MANYQASVLTLVVSQKVEGGVAEDRSDVLAMQRSLDLKTCGILGVARPPGRAPATPPGGASRPATNAGRPRTPRRLGSRPKLHLHN